MWALCAALRELCRDNWHEKLFIHVDKTHKYYPKARNGYTFAYLYDTFLPQTSYHFTMTSFNTEIESPICEIRQGQKTLAYLR